MATVRHDITTKNEWTRISAAGQSGTIWARSGYPAVYIDHTVDEGGDTIAIGSTVNLTVAKSRALTTDILIASNDTTLDIYYAIIIDDGIGSIVADFV